MTTSIMPGCEPFSAGDGPLGVLVLHGFTGNPATMRPLAERCVAKGYRVELPRLPGHGTSVADMMTTGWSDWSTTALEAYDALASHCEKVAVVGLSMGGALTAFVAEQRSSVAGCVLINPVVQSPGPEMEAGVQDLLDAGVEVLDAIGSDIKKEGAVEASYDATPVACVASLFAALHDVAANLSTITAPALVISSREDHVVTSDNGDAIVANASGPVERLWLEDSYHVATLDNDAELVETATLEFLAKVFG